MDMEADDSFSDLSEFSDLSDFSNLTETLWGSSDEEDGDCVAESMPAEPALVEGRKLWLHAEDLPPKSANKPWRRMDMEERIAQMEQDYGPNEFQETYKVTV